MIFAHFIIPQIIYMLNLAEKIKSNGAGTIACITLTLIPCINPTCTLLLLGQYKKRLLKMFNCSKKFQIKTNVDRLNFS